MNRTENSTAPRQQAAESGTPYSQTVTEPSLTEESVLEAMLEDDTVVRFPPIEEYTVKARIESIRRDEPASKAESEQTLTEEAVEESVDEESLLEAMLEDDTVAHFPPLEQYTVKIRIESIRRGKSNIADPE